MNLTSRLNSSFVYFHICEIVPKPGRPWDSTLSPALARDSKSGRTSLGANDLNYESAVMLYTTDFSFELACTRVPKFPREQTIRLAEMRIDKLNPTSYIQIVESHASCVGLLPTSGIAVWWHGLRLSHDLRFQTRPLGVPSALWHQRGAGCMASVVKSEEHRLIDCSPPRQRRGDPVTHHLPRVRLPISSWSGSV